MERQNPGKCGSGPETLDSLPHQVNVQSREPRGNGEASRPGQLPARSSAHDHGGARAAGGTGEPSPASAEVPAEVASLNITARDPAPCAPSPLPQAWFPPPRRA